MKYAGFFKRLIALIIDTLVITSVTYFVPDGDYEQFIALIISFAYFVWMNGMYGATIGKLLLKIKIVKEDGKKINYADALLRELASGLSMIVLFLGYLNVLWDSRKQSWHDKIAKTVVIRV